MAHEGQVIHVSLVEDGGDEMKPFETGGSRIRGGAWLAMHIQ